MEAKNFPLQLGGIALNYHISSLNGNSAILD
jgi:hypothetical protein